MIGDHVTNEPFAEPTPRTDATVEYYASRPMKRMRSYALIGVCCIVAGFALEIDSDIADRATAIYAALWALGFFILPIAFWMRWSTRRNARKLKELVRNGVAYRAEVIRDYHALGAHQVALAWHENGRELAATFHVTADHAIGREAVILSSPRWRKVGALLGADRLALARKSRRLGRRRHLRGGDSGTGAITGMPTARVITPRKPHDP